MKIIKNTVSIILIFIGLTTIIWGGWQVHLDLDKRSQQEAALKQRKGVAEVMAENEAAAWKAKANGLRNEVETAIQAKISASEAVKRANETVSMAYWKSFLLPDGLWHPSFGSCGPGLACRMEEQIDTRDAKTRAKDAKNRVRYEAAMVEKAAAKAKLEAAMAEESAAAEKEKQRQIEQLSTIDIILHSMQEGNIAFNAPTNISLYETAHIHLLLGIEQTFEELKKIIGFDIVENKFSSAIVTGRVRVAPLMQANLESGSFEIKSLTPNEQPISSDVTTEWLWEVIPKHSGTNTLYLTLNAKLPVEGSSTYRTIKTFKKEITVDVSKPQQVGEFLKDNWQWLWTAILVPIGARLWSKGDSKSTKKQPGSYKKR